MRKRILSALLCAAMLSVLTVGCEPASSSQAGSSSQAESSAQEKSSSQSAPASEASSKASSQPSGKGETLSLLAVWNDPMDGIQAVCKEAESKLGIKVEYEQFTGGEEGDNIIKTRLASGDIADISLYNCGSLLKALNPAEYFVDLSSQSFASKLDETYKKAVTVDNALYGIPSSSSSVGAVIYNKDLYKKHNLEIPHTWDDFLKNCKTLKAAGETAVLGSYGTSWTAQIPYLGDHYNVNAVNPKFAEQFEAGKIKYATDKTGLKSFQKIADLIPYLNSDYLATTYDDGCELMEEGKAVHWIVLSSALSNIYSLYAKDVNKFGIFGVPGDSADNHGVTVWEPSSFYANKNGSKIDAVMKFFDFYISNDGLNAYTSKILPNGPYCVKGYQLPDGCYDAVKQLQSDYFDTGKTALALEFQTAVKGPNCASICQELGSGQTTAAQAAAKYDQDCEKQAKQLGLKW